MGAEAKRDGPLLADRYQLEAEIGRGAIGAVWQARDLTTGERVAAKVLSPETPHDHDVVKSLLDEAQTLSQLNHPSIVRPRDVVSNGLRALVMDLVEGVDLRKRIRGGGPLPSAEAAEIAAVIADALASVHSAGMIHGDVKPGNIMIPSDGGPAKLVDFGVARRIQLPDTVTHATPEYVAPEVVAGGVPTPASDVYSMGMVMCEMACGRSPHRGGSVQEVLDRHGSCAPAQPAGMPDELWSLIRRCVALEPAARPAAAQLASSVRRLAPRLVGRPALSILPESATTWRPRLIEPSGRPVSAAPAERATPAEPAAQLVGGPPSASKNSSRSRTTLALGCVAASLLVSVGGAFLVWSGGGSATTVVDRAPSEASGDGGPQVGTSTTPPASPGGEAAKSPSASPRPEETRTGDARPSPPEGAGSQDDSGGDDRGADDSGDGNQGGDGGGDHPGTGDPMPTFPR